MTSNDTQEITRFLDILEARIQDLGQSMGTLSGNLPQGAQSGKRIRFADYVTLRDLTSECWAFSIVIERRIEGLDDDRRSPLQSRFSRLMVQIWASLLNCSLEFLGALSKEENLPLGSREIFLREIKTLYDANKWLSNPRFSDLIDESMNSKQHQAERILTTIINRAPTLLELG